MSATLDSVKGQAVLFSEMTPPEGREDAFNDWYDGHHSPSHVQGVPGFISAMRYRSGLGPHYLAVYELTGPEALEHEEYKKRKLTPDDPTYQMLQSVSGFTRYIANEAHFRVRDAVSGMPLDAPVIHCQLYTVPMERRGNFEEWYDTEHIPILLEDEDWQMVRRLDIVAWDPEPHTHLVLHYLSDARALEGDALKRARSTEWCRRLTGDSWFAPLAVTYHRRNNRFLKSG